MELLLFPLFKPLMKIVTLTNEFLGETFIFIWSIFNMNTVNIKYNVLKFLELRHSTKCSLLLTVEE